MPFPSETFLQHIRNSAVAAGQWVSDEFNNLYAQIEGYLRTEHKDDGTHGDITGDSLTLVKDDDTGATGDIDAGGDLAVGGYGSFLGGQLRVGTGANLGLTAETGINTGQPTLSQTGVFGAEWFQAPGADAYDEGFFWVLDNAAISTDRALALYWVSGSTRYEFGPPGTTSATHYLGSSTNRWDAVYGVAGNFSSTVTAGTGITSTDGNIDAVDGYVDGHEGFQERGRSTKLGDWATFDPDWEAPSVSPDIGSGAIVARYTIIGTTVHARMRMDFASDTTFGTGDWTFDLPETIAGLGTGHAIAGTVVISDSDGVNGYLGGWVNVLSDDTFELKTIAGNVFDATTPITWADGDEITLVMTYEQG